MRDLYLTHFGLREPPFSKEIPDGELWLPSSKQAVVDELVDAVEERTSVVLVGDPGWARPASCAPSANACPRLPSASPTATTSPSAAATSIASSASPSVCHRRLPPLASSTLLPPT